MFTRLMRDTASLDSTRKMDTPLSTRSIDDVTVDSTNFTHMADFDNTNILNTVFTQNNYKLSQSQSIFSSKEYTKLSCKWYILLLPLSLNSLARNMVQTFLSDSYLQNKNTRLIILYSETCIKRTPY